MDCNVASISNDGLPSAGGNCAVGGCQGGNKTDMWLHVTNTSDTRR